MHWRMDVLEGIISSRCLTIVLLLHLLLWTECDAESLPYEPEVPTEESINSFNTLGGTCTADIHCSVGIKNGVCDKEFRQCVCHDKFPVVVGTMCYEASPLNHTCVFDDQCEYVTKNSSCLRNVCDCDPGFNKDIFRNGTGNCVLYKPRSEPEVGVDITMLGIVIGMGVMFAVMCIVLRMFSKARFREQRTIFNSPHLMKLSLSRKSRESESRRGSRTSVPSRQPSVYSGLNLPGKSPTGSIASGDRRSLASQRSGTQSPIDERKALARNADQVTVDIKGGREDGTSQRTNQV